jgi:hypothetical protein
MAELIHFFGLPLHRELLPALKVSQTYNIPTAFRSTNTGAAPTLLPFRLHKLELWVLSSSKWLPSDHDIYQMSRAWRHLALLNVACGGPDERNLGSLSSMSELLTHCPKLRSLKLSMVIRAPYPSIPPGPAGTYRLDSLDLSYSPISDALSFASWLCFICPVSGFTSCTNPEVKDMLATLQSQVHIEREKWGKEVAALSAEKNKLLQDNSDLQASLRAARLENQILRTGRADVEAFEMYVFVIMRSSNVAKSMLSVLKEDPSAEAHGVKHDQG